ncbi:hypothetical protein BaRGS_00021376 [Batillaria attramentaria]|uniref:C2H2-type domain-containing protein n=1 Tax=Batillaria attramentaria TaxID=370345 RepID=A0ABD0KJS2_9CAEN
MRIRKTSRQQSVMATVQPGRKRQRASQCILNIEQDVFDRWSRIGDVEGLPTDTAIARFCIEIYDGRNPDLNTRGTTVLQEKTRESDILPQNLHQKKKQTRSGFEEKRQMTNKPASGFTCESPAVPADPLPPAETCDSIADLGLARDSDDDNYDALIPAVGDRSADETTFDNVTSASASGTSASPNKTAEFADDAVFDIYTSASTDSKTGREFSDTVSQNRQGSGTGITGKDTPQASRGCLVKTQRQRVQPSRKSAVTKKWLGELDDPDEACDSEEPENGYTDHVCRQCWTSFSNDNKLRKHVQTVHELKKSFFCTSCGEAFVSRGGLALHLKTHPADMPVKCGECEETFMTETCLGIHEMTFHPDGHLRKCHECGKSFRNVSLLQQHVAKRTCSKKLFICDQCGDSLPSKQNLAKHVFKKHSNSVPRPTVSYICDACGKKYMSKSDLKQHEKCHSDARPYRCEVCGATFKTAQALDRHSYKHSVGFSVACSFCFRAYYNPYILRAHEKMHTECRLFECSDCSATFTRKIYFDRHLKRHSAHRPFQCDQCYVGCHSMRELKIHYRTHTGEKPLVCPTCGARFARHDYLKKHKATHVGETLNTCLQCGVSFRHRNSLTRHLKTHAEVPTPQSASGGSTEGDIGVPWPNMQVIPDSTGVVFVEPNPSARLAADGCWLQRDFGQAEVATQDADHQPQDYVDPQGDGHEVMDVDFLDRVDLNVEVRRGLGSGWACGDECL